MHILELLLVLCCFSSQTAFHNFGIKYNYLHSIKLHIKCSLDDSLATLEDYNKEYLIRMKQGRLEGKTPKRIQLERAQVLKSEGIKSERQRLRDAVMEVRKSSVEVSMGILADTGDSAIQTLKSWVSGLELAHGKLHGVDDAGDDVVIEELLEIPVYIKYNSSDSNNAYIKKYKSDGFVGVIFQPKLNDGEFRQYGDLPLKLF